MKTIVSTLILSLSLCTFSQAQTISINLAEDDAGVPRANQTLLPGDLAGATGFEAVNWNNALFSIGFLNGLIDDSAAPTAASVSWASANGWGDGTADTDANAGVPNAKLQRGYVDDTGPGDTATVNVDDIPYDDYDLVLYLSSDNPGMIHGEFSVNGSAIPNGGTIMNWEDQPSLDIGRNVLVVSGLNASSLDIVGTKVTGTRATISGVQIVKVPEPGTLGGLLVTALWGLVWFRRR